MEIVKLARVAMATRFELVLCGEDRVRLRAVGEEALREIDRLDRQLSFYRPSSDTSRINRAAHQQSVRIEGRLFELLLKAKELSQRTEGMFDLTVGPLMRIWGLSGSVGRLPDPDELADIRNRIGMHHVVLEPETRSVRFEREGVQIDLGGVGKGYAVDEVIHQLRDAGVTSALVHGGTSTVATIGNEPDGRPWQVAIGASEAPRHDDDVCSSGRARSASQVVRNGRPHDPGRQPILAVVELRDQSLSVSDVGGKSFEIDGVTYGHVIDPRTCAPTSGRRLVAVVGSSATEADALSTALLVADSDERSRLKLGFANTRMLTTDLSGAVDYSDFASPEGATAKAEIVVPS